VGFIPKMEKVAIFIDGGYFGKVLDKYFSGVRVDYLELCNCICDNLNLNRLRTYFYHCLPKIRKGNKDDERRFSRMQLFLSNLRRLPRFEVKVGKLQIIGGQFRQKMIDVLMSLDIVDMCFDNQIQHAVLIAGDSDFIPAVKKAKDCGAITHLFYHPKSVHNEILDEIDELHIISDELIDKCKKLK
jgi:uncharacterized LabA/DUF88 family protein